MADDPWLDTAIEQAKAWDARRERSLQKELGWSGMADCRQYMGYRLRDEWPSEDRDTWRAITGTAMHAWLGGVRSEASDPARNIEWEVPVTYRGIPGHADEIDWTGREITDFKFPSLASAVLWDDPEVQDERFIQPQGYAAGVVSSPFWKHLHGSSKKATVRVLVAPVDGTFDDWKTYVRPFDQAVADDAADRYFRVVGATAAGETDLPKDKPWWWCEKFCEFYSLCRGGEVRTGLPEITDPETAAAVEMLGLANEAHAAAEKTRKLLGPVVHGAHGTARGFKVYRTKGGTGKYVPDPDAMARRFERAGMEVPMRKVDGRPPLLKVVRDGKKGETEE